MEFKAFRTHLTDSCVENRVETISMLELGENEIIVKVYYSGLNYKDYLSSRGNKGVTKNYPHTPGIDAAGVVVEDATGTFQQGDEVIVMGYDMGMNTDGAFAEYIKVPTAWVLARPSKFSAKECMQIGTSGFTAALGISKILRSGQIPEAGPIVVSGATGGVGVWAVQMLSKLGFEVWAMTGKPEAEAQLMQLGAAKIITRDEVLVPAEKLLMRPRWAGAFDAVGGETLSSLIKQCSKEGCVVTCGNVGGMNLSLTVLPFILNGVNLLGINAADTIMPIRKEVWKLLEEIADPAIVCELGKEITMEQLDSALTEIGNSSHTGRFLLKI